MSLTFDASSAEAILRVEGNVDIGCAAEFKRMLIEAFRLGKPVRMDLSKAGDLDVTAVQLLWAAKCNAEKNGVEFAVAGGLPDEVSGAISAAGLEKFLATAATTERADGAAEPAGADKAAAVLIVLGDAPPPEQLTQT
ncbi:MAG: STAS domain-containing protein [Terriglobales bacterium]